MDVKQGDIYYLCLDGARGSEQKGFRPCIVLSNNIINTYSNTIIVAPLTTKKHDNYIQHYTLVLNNQWNTILLEQIRTVDKSRICSKMLTLDNKNLTNVLKKLNKLFTKGD